MFPPLGVICNYPPPLLILFLNHSSRSDRGNPVFVLVHIVASVGIGFEGLMGNNAGNAVFVFIDIQSPIRIFLDGLGRGGRRQSILGVIYYYIVCIDDLMKNKLKNTY